MIKLKKILLVAILLALVIAPVALAKSEAQEVKKGTKIQTKNEGEDQQLQVSTQDQSEFGEDQNEGTGSGKSGKEANSRSEVAREQMSAVATAVEELLVSRVAQGGIGEQVREIAQAQNEAQEKITAKLNQVDSRGGLLKSLIGPDYKAIKELKQEMQQNEVRVRQLGQLALQTENEQEQMEIDATILALTDQNNALQERADEEAGSFSLFGWLFKLLAS